MDTLFDDYVAELTQRSAKREGDPLFPSSAAKQPYLDFSRSIGGIGDPGIQQHQQHMSRPSSLSENGDGTAPSSSLSHPGGSTGYGAFGDVNIGGAHHQSIGTGFVSTDGAGKALGYGVGDVGGGGSSSDLRADSPVDGEGEDAEGQSNGTDLRKKRSKSGGKGSKTMKAQEANKAAQQRYRERKKARFAELEKMVDELRRELEQLQGLEQRNKILESMNTNLQSALVEKEQELDRLKLTMDTQADHSIMQCRESDTGKKSSSKNGELGPTAKSDEQNTCVPCNVLPQDLTGIDFETGFKEQIEILRDFMAKHNIHLDPKTSGPNNGMECNSGDAKMENIEISESVPLPVLKDLAKIVGRCCQLCQAALRTEGPRAFELIERTPEDLRIRGKENGEEQSAWMYALMVMNLSQEQQEQLLLLRRSHLEKMKIVYKERQELNLEAMSMMLPHHARHSMEDTTVEGRMNSMATQGYLSVAKSNAELGSVLDSIKDNLRKEQRYVMDLNCCTVARILTP